MKECKMEIFAFKNEDGKIVSSLCGEDVNPPIGAISVPDLWRMAHGEDIQARRIKLDDNRCVDAFLVFGKIHFTFWNGAMRTDLRLNEDAANAAMQLCVELFKVADQSPRGASA
jgi:hypothetical protein